MRTSREDCRQACEAVGSGNSGDLRMLINRGRGLCNCSCGKQRSTLLHVAASNGCVACAHILTSALVDCDVNSVNAEGAVPLHLATDNCQSDMANVWPESPWITFVVENFVCLVVFAKTWSKPQCKG